MSGLRLRKWSACLLLTFSLLGIKAEGQDISFAGRQSDFQAFVQDFEGSYAYIDRPDKPWLTWEDRYGEAVAEAKTKAAFAGVLASALDELHDFHAEVRSHVVDAWLPVPTFADIWAENVGLEAVVTAVRPGSDAERAGVHVGNKVVSVNKEPLQQALLTRIVRVKETMPSVEAATRTWALLSILTGRSEEARVLTLADPSGLSHTVTLQVERRFDRLTGALSARTLPGNIGLVRFNNSLGEQSTVGAFDAALERLRQTRGLVLDLRDVPSGGDSSVTLGIMGRLVSSSLPYQRHRIPHYGQADVERNWLELVTPRGPFTYSAPVVVLVDHWTGSMGEGVAVGFDAMRRATVVGTPMAHLAGAVSESTLPHTGVRVAYPTEQVFHVDGKPRQDWLPPVLVLQTPDAGDAVLARGLEALQAQFR